MRMCIQCKERQAQSALLRFQCKSNDVVPYSGESRSFYICHTCANMTKTVHHIMRRCSIKKEAFERVSQQLKDSIIHG